MQALKTTSGLKSLLASLLDISVLWLLVILAVGGGVGTFAASCLVVDADHGRRDGNFYNILGQTVFNVAGSYCTVVPVLHDRWNRGARAAAHRARGIRLRRFFRSDRPLDDGTEDPRPRIQLPAHVVFWVAFLATNATAVAAPIAYVTAAEYYANVANGLSFASTFFALVMASQLAAGIMR